MTTTFKFALAIVVLAVLGFLVYIWNERRQTSQEAGGYSSEEMVEIKQASPEVKAALEEAEGQMLKPENQQEYRHSKPDFSFSFPKEMKAGNFFDGGGETVLIQDAENKLGMQIYVSDFEEDAVLTAERIKKDIPDMVVSQSVFVDLGGTKGVSFFSQNDSLGQTYEVWVVRNKKLYQISAYAYQKQLADKILATWEWGKGN